MNAFDFPPGFQTRDIATNGTTIHVRSGGSGPAVLLLHGYGETGDMWAPMAADLARDHTVVVPDLRGMGLSSKPAGGFDKKTQAVDMAGVLDALKIERADLVTHDIGIMVGYALAAQYPDRITRFVLIDAPLPGVGPWEEILKNPLLWHFRFGGPDMERLVAGRERIYLDRFWNEFSATPAALQRSGPRALCEALRAAGRDAFRLHAVRRVRSGCDRQPGNSWPRASSRCRCWPSAAKSPSARAMAKIMQFAASNVREGDHPGFRPLDHGGKPDRDDRGGADLPRIRRMTASRQAVRELASRSVVNGPERTCPCPC